MYLQPRPIALSSLIAALALAVAACGSGGGSNSMGMTSPQTQAQMRLSVGDKPPADNAVHVVVVFTGVELTADSGSPVTINFATPKSIDLMTESGTASAVLFDQPIPPGSYGQIRLMVMADGTANNSYIDFADGSRMGLRIPSGSQTGLKLVSGFTVPSSGVVDYTIDFDLRQAITCPPGQAPACILKPVERLVDNTAVGNIQGHVTSTLPPGCNNPGVYLYSGSVARPGGNFDTAAGDPSHPLASKIPVATGSMPPYYQFTFLPPGTYTIAFTCEADADTDGSAASPPTPPPTPLTLMLAPVATTAVTAGQTATVDIALGSIQGQINPLPSGCTAATAVPGVYLYSGSVATPEDWNTAAPFTDTNQPLASTLPVSTSAPPYSYQFAALPTGTYTLALTCKADNTGAPDGLSFSPVKTGIAVTADTATTVNLP